MTESNDNKEKEINEKENKETKGAAELSAEEQEELLKKFDAESNTRNLTGIAAWIVFGVLFS